MEKAHQSYDVCVIGSGMAGLTAAAMLAKDGLKVAVLEQNWLPGGCTSSYWRKGFVFESGATTLVGLDEYMPLRFLLEQTGVELKPMPLSLPMKVYLADGTVINRYQDLDAWIAEAERVFGPKNQRAFWEFCYKISGFVWETSLKQTAFPPSNFSDLLYAAKRASLRQVRYAGYSLMSTRQLLQRFGLADNQRFVDFVNEQLLITAQNYVDEVNVLFGATALCYTNYTNYYMPGGLINLVNPITEYITQKGGEVLLRTTVTRIEEQQGKYLLETAKHGTFSCNYLVSAIPVNNTLELFREGPKKKFHRKAMGSKQLNSAFQMGIGFKKSKDFDCIHHQVHLENPLPEVGSHSIFISLSHPDDPGRADAPGQMVASVSTHVHDPANRWIAHKEKAEEAVIAEMEKWGFLRREDIVYFHSSTPKSWQKWTGRAFGFVGGYPQYMQIKPWQMLDARLDGKKAYICGDTTYPGQGIPGATLSGIIAYEKLKRDHLQG